MQSVRHHALTQVLSLKADTQKLHIRDHGPRRKNESEVSYFVVFCDIERPMRHRRTAALNRISSNVTLRAATSSNEAGDRTGLLNRAFKYIDAIRRLGNGIKARHRTNYYAAK